MLTNVVKIIDLDGTNVVKIAKKAGWRKRDGRYKKQSSRITIDPTASVK